MTLEQWFEKGMSIEQYVGEMEKNKDHLHYIYGQFELPKEQDKLERNLRAIILTEDWCGDAMVNVPILMHIAEHHNIELRVLLRDENLELMDQYLTNGTARSIPIFIFIDEEGNEVAKWGPRAPEVQERVSALMSELPEKTAPNYEEEWKKAIKSMTTMYREDEQIWSDVYHSIQSTLR
ncbi:thioredoxin [Bacillaceae bacterium JMAK1]|nr:thioredoxin [Bacillaceae bacterium JMAK1]